MEKYPLLICTDHYCFPGSCEGVCRMVSLPEQLHSGSQMARSSYQVVVIALTKFPSNFSHPGKTADPQIGTGATGFPQCDQRLHVLFSAAKAAIISHDFLLSINSYAYYNPENSELARNFRISLFVRSGINAGGIGNHFEHSMAEPV